MTPVNGYKLDKYDRGSMGYSSLQNGPRQRVRIVDILFETNTSENHEYMFLENWWI